MSTTRALFIMLGASFVMLAVALALSAAGGQEALAADGIIYVDADAIGLGNGTSWADAFTTLQPALDGSQGGNQIWVAAGTYKPTYMFSPGDPRSATFQLKNGVALYGGFDPAAGDIDWEDRDWVTHETILSGDLNGDDVPPFGNNDENSYHVLYHPEGTDLDATAILDGFVVSGGNANGNYPHRNGGGMANVSSSPVLANCTFLGNSADSGGGMSNIDSSPALADCTFLGNSADSGGGMSNVDSSPALADCTFLGNSGTFGGGVHNNGSSPTLTNCTFSGNSVQSGGGGGMYNWDSSSPVLNNCTFSGNSAAYGGGMSNGLSSPVLTNCTFSGNSATSSTGGGMDNYESSPVLTNCTFSGNLADWDGGGMYNSLSLPVLTNCTFSGNSASSGGGMYNGLSSPVLTNCTFSGNLGSGMYNSSSSPVLTNCILWGDSPSEIYNYSSQPTVTYSDIQGGSDGTGNIDANPLFEEPGSGDYHLGPGSPCIDAGTNDAPHLPDSDFEGDPRVMDGNGDATAVVDMGSDEVLAKIIYVDQDALGINNGTSWEDAYTTLQAALEEAAGGNHIWAAEGIYTPSLEFSPGDPRSAAFQLKNGVALYGGFDPTVGDVGWEDRDWVSNVTVLSGDVGTVGDAGDNSYHVFYHPPGLALDDTAVLDGFTVTGGNANGDPPDHDRGGGMYNYHSSPTVTNCTFSGNSADIGAGMYNYYSSPTVTNCIFLANLGGGMSNLASSPMVTNCTFSSNSAAQQGGGMSNSSSSPLVANCIFLGNSADSVGGGMSNGNASAPIVTDCTFSGNSATGGGGMDNVSSSPVVTNCTFSGNSASYGGGMNNWEGSSPAVTNCTFSGNSASYGGGMRNTSSSPAVTDSTFTGNSADYGGGMNNWEGSSPNVTNCTFWGNSADEGGGIHNYASSSPAVANCILWGDDPDEVSGGSSVITYSDIQGGWSGTGNIDADPLFVDPGSDNYHLGAGSPCIDAGTTDAPNLPGSDFEGDPRVLDGDADGTAVVDMGVDEVWGVPPVVIYVDQDAAGYNNGTSWEDALTSLQDALAWAVDGVEIWVAEGTYTPTLELSPGDPRSAAFQLKNGVALYGGFDPTVGDVGWEGRDWVNNVTVLSGDIGTVGDRHDNSYHVFYHPWLLALNGSAILDGFTVTDGNANGNREHNDGGGMYNSSSSPTVTNCTFAGNSANLDGGGMANASSSPALTDCAFSGNSAIYGAGMHNWSSSPAVTSCTFSDNSAQNGGAMFNHRSAPALTNCTFSDNVTTNSGGAMYNTHSSPTLTNCTFSGNSATSFGGGGMHNSYSSSPAVMNCILWGDDPDEVSGDSPVITYSDIQGGWSGTGNIDADPLFVDPAVGDFHLGLDSPCIDAGTNDAPALPLYDFEDDPRILDGDGNVTRVVDMGVDEVAVDWPYFHGYLPLMLKGY